MAEDHLRQLNPGARLETFGEELNAETYEVCKSDLIIKGPTLLRREDWPTRSQRSALGTRPRRRSSRIPRGKRPRKKVEDTIRKEHEKLGFAGRFGAGLPRRSEAVAAADYKAHAIRRTAKRPKF